MISQKLQR